MRTVIDGQPVYPGRPCQHSTGAGCRVYEIRPEEPCRRFECDWVRPDSVLPQWMKPNEARVIVLPALRLWQGLPVDVALPVGRRIPERALGWLRRHAEQTGRPLIYLEHERQGTGLNDRPQVMGCGPPAFRQELAERLAAGETLW